MLGTNKKNILVCRIIAFLSIIGLFFDNHHLFHEMANIFQKCFQANIFAFVFSSEKSPFGLKDVLTAITI